LSAWRDRPVAQDTTAVGQALGAAPRRAARAGARTLRSVERRVTAPLHVLCYHRVADLRCDPWKLCVSPAAFAGQMAALVEAAEVVRLEHELPSHRQRALGSIGRPGRVRPRVAVTFDDGYVDTLEVALPVLERHAVPATVFVPTAFVGRRSFWWDRLDLLVLDLDRDPVRTAGALTAAGARLGSPPTAGWTTDSLHRRATDAVTGLGPDEIDALIDAAAADLGVALEPDGRPVTSDELRRLASHALITVAVHTHRHRRLTAVPAEVARNEIEVGRSTLDEMVGSTPPILAYPHGAADRSVATLAGAAGFTHALTTADRPVSLLDRDRLLPRRHPKDLDGREFREWLLSG
jgi:peptidoglycan/xylan/chitin deacetylase (PgdA/CDA1 family)